MKYNNINYNTLPQQVEKNMDDIKELKNRKFTIWIASIDIENEILIDLSDVELPPNTQLLPGSIIIGTDNFVASVIYVGDDTVELSANKIQTVSGPQGEQGPQGLQGEQGPQGLQGVKGDPGTGTLIDPHVYTISNNEGENVVQLAYTSAVGITFGWDAHSSNIHYMGQNASSIDGAWESSIDWNNSQVRVRVTKIGGGLPISRDLYVRVIKLTV